MSEKKTRSRVCNQCGKERAYSEIECDRYRNRYNVECLYAPKGSMLILSIPTVGEKRDFLDFCSMECLKAFAEGQIKASLDEIHGEENE